MNEREACFDPRQVTEPHACPGRCGCYINHFCHPGCACTSCNHGRDAHLAQWAEHFDRYARETGDDPHAPGEDPVGQERDILERAVRSVSEQAIKADAVVDKAFAAGRISAGSR